MAEAPSATRGGTDGDPRTSRPWWRMHRVTALVLAVGLAVTSVLAVAASAIHGSNEDRLLDQRLSESSLILTGVVPTITGQLTSAAELAEVSDADPAALRMVLAPVVGTKRGQTFQSVSVWRKDGKGPALFQIGEEPHQGAGHDTLASFIRRAKGPTLHVRDLLDSRSPALGYAVTSIRGLTKPASNRYVVYAESRLAEDRTTRTQSGGPFQNVEYAVYLGNRIDRQKLLLASTSDLPLHGNRAARTLKFGDTKLLMAMSSHDDLGGQLMARLPWLILLTGIAASIGFGQFAERLIRRREQAQALAFDVQRLYQDQRSVAETLQRSLLPDRLPDLPDIGFGARYEPGVEGIEIGGDWYDVVTIDEDRVLLVVGDVSGRGLGAGAVMASLRFAIRAHATQGDSPGTILHKLGTILQVGRDRHFATVLCVEVDRRAGLLRLANAGHPRPLYLDGEARFLETAVGPPIGVDATRTYEETTEPVSPGATLLMFTDGLVERRGEPIDESMERLRLTAAGLHAELDELLTAILARMIGGPTTDDTAILGARWRS